MNTADQQATLVVTRQFNAPKEMVFDAFANAEALSQWWGAPETLTNVAKLDFKPGGVFLYNYDMMGTIVWGRFIYKQIIKPDLLEFISSFSDENGGIIRAPFSNAFPLEIFNSLEFSEQDGVTTIVLKGYPLNATEEETAFFKTMETGMQKGFAGTFGQLEKYLSLQKSSK